MAKKKDKNEVATTEQETSVAAYEGYSDYEGKGFQNQTREDIAIPFINILQANSPEVDGDSPVDGAKAGLLINSVTQDLHTEVEFVPAITQHVFVEWIPRDQGGGMVGQHGLNSDVVKKAKGASTEFGKYVSETGNDLVETFYVFGILRKDGVPVGMAVMPFTSTKIKAYRAVMGRLNSFQITLPDKRRITPPMYAHSLKITTLKQSNKHGTFYIPVVQPAVENDVEKSLLPPDDACFLMAAECEKLVDSGKAYADTESINREPGSDDTNDDPF